jgi:hypothetical protein
MDENVTYVRLLQTPEGELWMARQDAAGQWVPYHKINQLIDGNDLIIKESTSIIEDIVS